MQHLGVIMIGIGWLLCWLGAEIRKRRRRTSATWVFRVGFALAVGGFLSLGLETVLPIAF